ncbi:hypothetical protein WA158_003648 [Blastocystis sp. Blastoise]
MSEGDSELVSTLKKLQEVASKSNSVNILSDEKCIRLIRLMRKNSFITPGKRLPKKQQEDSVKSKTKQEKEKPVSVKSTVVSSPISISSSSITVEPILSSRLQKYHRPTGQKELVMETYLGLVSDIYNTITPLPNNKKDANTFFSRRVHSLKALVSKLRPMIPAENWTPYEIAVFESAVSVMGKEFHTIAKLLPNKTTAQVIDFYYYWKHTSHYDTWKKHYNSQFTYP